MTTLTFTELETAEQDLQRLLDAVRRARRRLDAAELADPTDPAATAFWQEYGGDTALNIGVLDDLLTCAQELLTDHPTAGLLAAELAAPTVFPSVPADPDWDALTLPVAQTDAQRSRIYQLLTDLAMHDRYIAAWLHHHFGPAVDLVEELSYSQSVVAIADRERKLADRAAKEARR